MIRNSLLYRNFSGSVAFGEKASPGRARVDHNLFFESETAEDPVYGNNPIVGDPRFIDPDDNNFGLAKNSPGRDRGNPEGAPKIDFNGTKRPLGG